MQVIIISFLLGLLNVSCSLRPEKVGSNDLNESELVEGLIGQINARWHELAPEWAQLKNVEGNFPPHLFWDVAPAISTESKTLNFVVQVPQGSSVWYGLDVSSGQHYTIGPYCSQPDSWKNTTSNINRPPFTMGIVPRVLDQLMLPQKIIVFGNPAFYQQHFKTNYFDARVVGAYIEQLCPESTCQDMDSWRSRLVLIGVQKNHPRYEKVKNLEQLKKLVDWKHVQAFVENGQGKNIMLKKYLPAYRMGSLVDASQALHFLAKNGHIFSVEEMKEMKLGCYKLYSHLNTVLGFEKKQDDEKDQKTTVSTSQKISSRVVDKTDMKKKKEQPFFRRFISTYKKFHAQIRTCSDYVYPSNVQHDRDRHWMMAHVFAFAKLSQLGYSYDCSRKGWFPNPLVGPGRRMEPIEDQLKYCTASSIDRAFGMAVQMLNRLHNTNRNSHRYIDFDQGALGTHNRMYSWVPYDGKTLECQEFTKYHENIRTFPSDIRWEPREALQGKGLGDIIY